MAEPPYLAAVFLASVVGMVVAFLVWLHRDRPGAAPLAVFVVAASLWAVAQGLELAAPDLAVMVGLVRLQLTLSTVIPLAWLVTVLEYTGWRAWLTRRRLALLLVEPAVFAALVWSNDAHALVWQGSRTATVVGFSALAPQHGLAFWAHLVYSYALVLAGGVLLLRVIFRDHRLYRWQATALLFAIVLPVVAQALSLFGVVSPGLDPTSLGYVGSGIVLAAAILRQDLLDIVPLASDLGREAVFNEMTDAVVILDDRDRVVDCNDAGRSLTDAEEPVGSHLSAAFPDLAARLPDDDRLSTELSLEHDGRVRYYDVRVSPLYRAYGAVTGRIVSLRDVTGRRQRQQRLNVLNRLLRHNVRNEMNVVRGNAELLARAVEDPEGRIDRIRKTVDAVVDRSDRVRQASRALDDDRTPVQLADALDHVVDEARDRYPSADISQAVPDDIRVTAGPGLTLAFEELLDNAVEHGGEDASVRITATRDGDGRAVVRVEDDGPGIDRHDREIIEAGEETPLEHASGVGLWIVNWAVRDLGGTFSFEDRDDGTTAVVTLPCVDPPDEQR
ncbi:MAG: histidine kinase N-terminal 7TM domain-containing protein [Haloarculaceae archaeon]